MTTSKHAEYILKKTIIILQKKGNYQNIFLSEL